MCVSMQVSRAANPPSLNVALVSKKRLEINVTATFVDMCFTTMALWSKQGEDVLKKSRGHYSPFLIRNRTGYPMLLWASDDSNKREPTKLEHMKDVPWRFDDWKTMREVSDINALMRGY